MAESAQGVRVDLKHGFSAGRKATRAVRHLLIDVGAFALLQDATLAVTELVTSAVVRASSGCDLVATFLVDRDRLRVELRGCDFVVAPGRSVVRPEPNLYPVISALATEWGIDPSHEGREHDGAVVWFEMLRCSVADLPV